MTHYKDDNILVVQLTPGTLLKRAREERKVSYREIADKTHLSPNTIKQIEEDDYSHFSTATYIKGYFRSIARVLGIEETDIIAALNNLTLPGSTSEEQATIAVNSHLSLPVYSQMRDKRRHVVRWLTLAMGLLLIALVALWWKNQMMNTIADMTAPHEPLSATAKQKTANLPKKMVAIQPSPPTSSTTATSFAMPDLSAFMEKNFQSKNNSVNEANVETQKPNMTKRAIDHHDFRSVL